MSKLQNKICPLINKECLEGGCTLFEPRLDNCAIQVLIYNLYKVEKALKGGSVIHPGKDPNYPVPPQT
jgi:hypothetical protein